MEKKQLKYSGILVLTAVIWGLAFVAQAEGNTVGAFTFNSLRTLLGALVLVPVILLLDKLKLSARKPATKEERKYLWKSGIITGTALFFAQSLQQIGLNLGAGTGKAGFLTALYILIVPILGIALKKKCAWNIWAGAVLALIGMYFLCVRDGFSFTAADWCLIGCAFVFSIQILSIDYFSPKTDPVRLSAIEFLTAGLIGLPVFIVTEIVLRKDGFTAWCNALSGWNAWIPILYLGIMSTGVAYTLQTVAQPRLNPTVASMIMSLESVFSLIFGWIILNQKMSGRELFGCGLMFAAIILAQLPLEHIFRRKRKNG